jgi:iron complex outermembrane receptor protein
VLAQTTSTLPTVTVSAQRLQIQPEPSASVPSASLPAKRAATSDTASLLADVPGVSLMGAGGLSSLPIIHGLADDRLRVQLDGMDLLASCPNHMNPPLSYIDPAQVEQVTVYAGISPVSQGGDSIGGSIQVQSPAPTFAAPGQSAITQGEVGGFYRSNAAAHGVHAAVSYATDALFVGYSAATAQAGNYRAGADFKSYDFTGRLGHTLGRDEVGSTAYKTNNQALTLAFKHDNHLLQAQVGYQDLPYQLYPNQRMDMLDNTQHRVNLRYQGAFDWGALQVQAYDEQVNHFMDFGADKRYWYGTASGGSSAVNGTPCSPISATCAAGMPMYTDGHTKGLSTQADIQLNPANLLRVGALWQSYTLQDWWPPSGGGMWPATFWNIKDGERNRTALYGEWESQRSAQWRVQGGLRFEQVDMSAGAVSGYSPTMMNQGRDASAFNASARAQTDHNLDWTLSARYTPSATQTVDMGLAQKVRSPNVYERYSWSTAAMMASMNNFAGDGNGYLGNPALKPETAHTLSATWDWHSADRASQFKLTPYYTLVDDYIDAIAWDGTANKPATPLVPGQFNVLRYVNLSARIVGLDVSGQWPLQQNELGQWALKVVLNVTKGSNRDTEQALYNVMPMNARLTLTQQSGAWSNALEWVLVKAKTDVSTVRNETPTPGYALFNLRSSVAYKKLRFDFGIENLFNTFYDLPNGGAYVGQGTTMSLNPKPNYPQWGTAVPGMGRSVYAGLTLKF